MIIAGNHIESDNNEIFWSQQDHLLRLLNQSSFEDRQYEVLKREIETGMTLIRYAEIETLLLNHWIDPIAAGRNYDMKDINNKINREIL
jgi:hypothetical protein